MSSKVLFSCDYPIYSVGRLGDGGMDTLTDHNNTIHIFYFKIHCSYNAGLVAPEHTENLSLAHSWNEKMNLFPFNINLGNEVERQGNANQSTAPRRALSFSKKSCTGCTCTYTLF